MRHRFFVLLVLAGALSLPLRAAEVKFMTYNVQSPGWNQQRRAQVVATIDAEAPDVLGLHEASPFNNGLELLADLSDDYQAYATDTSDPVYVRLDSALQFVEQGVFALPVCGGPGGAAVLAWVTLETAAGARFTFYNSHFCVSFGPQGPTGNQLQAVAAAEFIAANTTPGDVHLLAGDLNASQNSATLHFLIDGDPLNINGDLFENPIELDDTWALAPGNAGENHPGTGAGGGQAIIDWILANPFVSVLDAEVIVFEIPPGEEDDYSDHFPVTATLEFGAGGGSGEVPDGDTVPGSQLRADRTPQGDLVLAWGRSCLPADIDFHVYQGTLGDFSSHTELACTTGGSANLVFTPAIDSSYYLVVPTDGTEEGSYGRWSDGTERPPGVSACQPQSPTAGCAQ